ncbi:flagellin, partial [Sphingomonas sp.]|uniref:flagellin n=1 Tax=Sphingomonas sp. TaxID=28214 RepID=UPI0035A97A85
SAPERSSAVISAAFNRARLDLETARLESTALTREAERSGIEDTDLTTAIIELQKTTTILQATQASLGRLSSLSLFDYLR